MARIGLRLWKEETLEIPPDLLSAISWTLSVEMPPPTPGRPILTVPT